jgi:hypothetical protein
VWKKCDWIDIGLVRILKVHIFEFIYFLHFYINSLKVHIFEFIYFLNFYIKNLNILGLMVKNIYFARR